MEGKISIYQVLPRLFDNPSGANVPNGAFETNGSGKLNAFTPAVLKEIADLGCTHIWYTGVLDHATLTSFPGKPGDHPAIVKGQAGSPYAIRDYYDVAPELAEDLEGRIREYHELIERSHRAGLRVIQDFVPNHVSRAYRSEMKPGYVKDFGEEDEPKKSFAKNNNFYYLPNSTLVLRSPAAGMANKDYMEFPARATGNDVFSASVTPNDWYETVKLNYGVDYYTGARHVDEPVPDTWQKMLDILLYWSAMGVDGFRCDMAEMVPVEFWRWCISRVRMSYPDVIFIAEIYRPDLYLDYVYAGFDYLYDKVGLYDTLIRVIKGEAPASDITRSWQQTQGVKGHLLHFMETHDEQRLASDFVVQDGHKAFPAMAVSTLIDSGPILTYFGQELNERGMDEEGYSGCDGRTTIFDYWQVPSIRQWIGDKRDFSGAELPPEAKELREKYRWLLNLAVKEKVFGRGQFFDLMYANDDRLDPRRHYAFLRATDGEFALVVANFSDQPSELNIRIPGHAFGTLHIQSHGLFYVKDLSTDRLGVAEARPDDLYPIEVPAYGVAVRYFMLP